jgi:hypothetical protein
VTLALWNVAVTYKWLLEEDTDVSAIRKNIVEVFFEFSKNSDEIRGSQPYAFHKAITAIPKPLSYYLLNEVVAKVMRFSWKTMVSSVISLDLRKREAFLDWVDVETEDQE